jgi:hypothetical protein
MPYVRVTSRPSDLSPVPGATPLRGCSDDDDDGDTAGAGAAATNGGSSSSSSVATAAAAVNVGIGIGPEEIVELPTEEDNSLSLATLEGQFPGAVGLQYRTASGCLRGVRICDGLLKEPEEGWGVNTLYYCVFPCEY